MKKIFVILSILPALWYTQTNSLSLKSVYSFFAPERFEEVEQKEIPINPNQNLVVIQERGPIHIQTWQQPRVMLKATKRTAKQELLPQLRVSIKSTKNALTIKTVCQEDCQGSIEYELLVPEATPVDVTAQNSKINVDHVTGPVTIHNELGDVQLLAVQGSADVEVTQKGAIAIEQPGNSIKVVTHNGNIDIHDAKKSIFASTDNGKIRASCKTVPQGSTIKLDAPGAITLQLPQDVNADIQAESEQGSIICDHYVTIKPFITQLNPKAWTQFKKNINGTIGSGNAQICLHSASGNSKISKVTA